jgi:hypothetical protein
MWCAVMRNRIELKVLAATLAVSSVALTESPLAVIIILLKQVTSETICFYYQIKHLFSQIYKIQQMMHHLQSPHTQHYKTSYES